uniref:Uncharacterized protein n=1 Tax=Tetraselmis sp. GSL018 TaxID=582737 RepID=A0A061QNL1_9CHLO
MESTATGRQAAEPTGNRHQIEAGVHLTTAQHRARKEPQISCAASGASETLCQAIRVLFGLFAGRKPGNIFQVQQQS